MEETSPLIKEETKIYEGEDTPQHLKHYDTLGRSSYFSTRHLTPSEVEYRTSTSVNSYLNLFKGYIGITFLAIPHGFLSVGLYGAIACLTVILLINFYSTWLIIKARNKFRSERMINLSDLVDKTYGSTGRTITEVVVIIA